MYHWRVVPRAAPASLTDDQRTEMERQVASWGGSQAVRERLHAVHFASAEIVVFLEYIPTTLRGWLATEIGKGELATRSAIAMIEPNLREVTSFLSSRGFLHLDAHFDNILTDGDGLYFADFGLAVCDGFELSGAESAFAECHADFDRAYVITRLVNQLIHTACGRDNRDPVVEEHIAGTRRSRLPPSMAAVVSRYASIAMLMNMFFARLLNESKTVAYPAIDIGPSLSRGRLDSMTLGPPFPFPVPSPQSDAMTPTANRAERPDRCAPDVPGQRDGVDNNL